MRPIAATPFHIEVSTAPGTRGRIDLAYVRFRTTAVATTLELDTDRLLADYDTGGSLVGIEILAPVELAALGAVLPAGQAADVRAALPGTLRPQ